MDRQKKKGQTHITPRQTHKTKRKAGRQEGRQDGRLADEETDRRDRHTGTDR